MSARGRLAVVSCVALALALGGCSSERRSAEPASSASPVPLVDAENLPPAHTATAAIEVLHDLTPEGLREAQPTNERDRLLAESVQLNDICAVIASIGSLDNPAPYNLDALLHWTERYLGYLRGLDPRKTFADRQAPERTQPQTKPPVEAVAVLRQERAFVFAYNQRLGLAKVLRSRGELDQPGALEAWISGSYQAFVTSGYQQADSILTQFQVDRCATFQPNSVIVPQAGGR